MKIHEKYFSRRRFRTLTLIWLVIIFTVSSIPSLPNPSMGFNEMTFRLDYIFHFIVFFILAFLAIFWQIDARLRIKPSHLIFLLVAGSAYAFIDEVHQLIIPGRRFNPVDFIYNFLGFNVGATFTYFIIIRQVIIKQKRFTTIKQMLYRTQK